MTKVIKELRPPTLIVALLSTCLGITTAYIQGYIFKNVIWDIWRSFLVTAGGVFLQCGVNLINNFFEEDDDEAALCEKEASFIGFKKNREEILIFKTGLVFFLFTIIIGVILCIYSGVQLIVIELIGIFAAYGYTGRPFNYKSKGMGAIMSFLMMGPLMVYGTYYVFSGAFSVYPILYSFTLCLFIPSILIANELRDYEEDKYKGVKTLTVRVGLKNGVKLYYLLIALAYINTILLCILGFLPVYSIIVLSTLLSMKKLQTYMKTDKRRLIPATAQIYMTFGVQFLLILIISKLFKII